MKNELQKNFQLFKCWKKFISEELAQRFKSHIPEPELPFVLKQCK